MENMVRYLSKKFSNKNILITGCAGFKGSYLCYILKNIFKANVFGIGNYNSHPKYNLWNKLSKKVDVNFLNLDLSESQKVKDVLLKNNFDYIFHLAAKSIVSYCQNNPLNAWNSNVLSFGNFLQNINDTQKNTIISVITTDKVYMNQEWNYNYRENDIIWRDDHYGASKVGAELICSAFAQTEMLKKNFGFNILRAGNVIGPGDFNDNRFFTDLYTALKRNETMYIRDENSTRPWQNIIDCLISYLIVASEETQGKYIEYNIGPKTNENIKVKKILEIINRKHKHFNWENSLNNKIQEAKLLSLDTIKFYSNFDFTPRYNTVETIENTIDWYVKFANGNWNSIDKQIEEYFYGK